MRKLLVVAAVALLALPAAATAKKPPHHGSGMTFKNAAKACKAERAQDHAAFAAKYGTNGNKRNAFGNCVSQKMHGHGYGHGRTLTLDEQGTGTTTSGAPNCQFTAEGCTVTGTGTITGEPIVTGTFSSTLTIKWQQATSNGQGGFCAPATGTATLTDSANTANTITKTETGTVCEVGPTGTNVAHHFEGTYTITGGTGIYAGATGSGTVSSSQPASSNAITVSEKGTIRLQRHAGGGHGDGHDHGGGDDHGHGHGHDDGEDDDD